MTLIPGIASRTRPPVWTRKYLLPRELARATDKGPEIPGLVPQWRTLAHGPARERQP